MTGNHETICERSDVNCQPPRAPFTAYPISHEGLPITERSETNWKSARSYGGGKSSQQLGHPFPALRRLSEFNAVTFYHTICSRRTRER